MTAALAATAVLAGCGDSAAQPSTSSGKGPLYPQITAAPAVDLAAADGSQGTVLSLPLDAYIMTSAQTATLNDAKHFLIATCMERFGYPASSAGSVPQAVSADAQSPLAWFRPTQLEAASRFGYHAPMTGSSASNQSGTGQSGTGAMPTQDPAEVVVLQGSKTGYVNGQMVPPGGCIGSATAKLSQGQTAQDANFVGDLRFQLAVRAQNESPQIRVANSAWSDCMKSMGFSYATPKDAAGDRRWGSAVPTSSEVAVAVADVKCKQKTNLVNVIAGVYQSYENQAITDHATQLKAIKDWENGQLANAAKVVATCSGAC
ncbi:hypothetical protein [Catenulispora sp. GP43]|uniref:hypothetical protein n=1 Tax=Catenulispora sp. GP43 TaxID=3156263 RepID=UPI003511AB5F